MFLLRQQAQALIQNVLCGVYIPVMGSAALGANPLPDGQVFRSWPLSTASGAKLTGRKEAVDRDHLFSVPRRFVLQLPPKLAPACVRNRPGKFVVLDHIGRSQILNRNQVIGSHKAGGQLMEHILPLVGNVFVETGYLYPRLFPAVTAP